MTSDPGAPAEVPAADVDACHITLHSNGPIDVDFAGRFLAGWPPATHHGADPDGALRLTCVRDDGSAAFGVALRQAAPARLTADFSRPPTAADVAQVRRILSLDWDVAVFEALGAQDPALATLQRRTPGVRPVLFGSPYEAAAWAVLSTRTPAARAAGFRRALMDRNGDTVCVGGVRRPSFPTPAQLRTITACPGLPEEKVRRLYGVADAADSGLLDASTLGALPADAALMQLKRIRGIGDFYAGLIYARATGVGDFLPGGEPRLRTAAARLLGRDDLTDQQLRQYAERWSPYRTWVAFLLRTAG